MRAKAISLFHEQKENANTAIETIITGKSSLYNLDIFAQQKTDTQTKNLLHIITKPKWTRSELNMALCKQYNKDFKLNTEIIMNDDFLIAYKDMDESVQNYFAYVLYDFSMCDTELNEPMTGYALNLSEHLFLSEALAKIIKKEKN